MASLQLIPCTIKQQIIDYTDMLSRFSLRKVSKDFLSQVDQSNAAYKKISVAINDGDIKVIISCIDDQSKLITYKKVENGCSVGAHFLRGEDFIEQSVRDIMTIFRNPRSVVKTLRITANDGFTRPRSIPKHNIGKFFHFLKQQLDKLPHKLLLKNLQMKLALEENEMLCVLPYTEPGFLKKMRLRMSRKEETLEKVTKLEQWKQAKELELEGCERVELTTMSHFERLTASGSTVGVQELGRLIESIPHQGNLISFEIQPIEFDQALFLERFGKRAENGHYYVEFPHSSCLLEIQITEKSLQLRRLNEL